MLCCVPPIQRKQRNWALHPLQWGSGHSSVCHGAHPSLHLPSLCHGRPVSLACPMSGTELQCSDLFSDSLYLIDYRQYLFLCCFLEVRNGEVLLEIKPRMPGTAVVFTLFLEVSCTETGFQTSFDSAPQLITHQALTSLIFFSRLTTEPFI